MLFKQRGTSLLIFAVFIRIQLAGLTDTGALERSGEITHLALKFSVTHKN